MSNQCNCRSPCLRPRARSADDLCLECWQQWATGSDDHGPAAERSYMAVYGITGFWTGWLISRGLGHLVASPLNDLRAKVARSCPDCGYPMVWRPGSWKCYRHEAPVVIAINEPMPRAPNIDALGSL